MSLSNSPARSIKEIQADLKRATEANLTYSSRKEMKFGQRVFEALSVELLLTINKNIKDIEEDSHPAHELIEEVEIEARNFN